MAALLTSTAALLWSSQSVLAQATGTLTVLHDFDGTDGDTPLQGPIKASDGNFYGVVSAGGNEGNGTIYKLTADGQFSVLHTFKNTLEGSLPKAIIQGTDGNLYGVTRGGGSYDENLENSLPSGTFFRLGLDGTFTKLYDFATKDTQTALFPSGIAQGGDGNFYGLSRDGGTANEGTFFRLSPDGATLTVLYSFVGSTSGPGIAPEAQLLVGQDGNFYGLTQESSAGGNGAIFEATPAGTITTLYAFRENGPSNNEYPLIQGSDGSFYGVAAEGGANDDGAIYRYGTDGSFSILHNFKGPNVDGELEFCSLVQGSDGNFYGSTNGFTDGSYFELTPDGTFTTLAETTADTSGPRGNLVEIGNLVFVGVTGAGGPKGQGTIIELTVTGGTAAHAPFFTGETALANGVYYLAFPSGNYFGYYSYLTDPAYIYHFDLGYEYVFDANDGNDGVYFYDFASNDFFYTSPGFPFPYLYDFGLNSTVYYYPDPNNAGHYNTNGVRYFYVFSTGQIISK